MTKIATLKANISNFTANIKEAAKVADEFKDRMKDSNNISLESTMTEWKNTGKQIKETSGEIMKFSGAVTAAFSAVVGLSVKTASSFEDAFADFRKVTEATAEEFAAIDSELKNLTKRIPATYEEIAMAAAAASRLGVAKEYVVDFAEAAVMMGTATNMGTEDAAESMARFSNIVGTSLGDVHNLGSAIVDLGNNFAASESEIMTMGLRLAAAGKSAGMSEGDILGLASAMTSLGLRAEMGGTAMSQVLNRIGSDLAHNGDEAEAWAKRADMSVDEFRAAFEDDALGALISLMEGLDEATKSGENLDIMLGELGISNIRQVDTMKRLTSGIDLLTEGQDRGNRAFEEGTALAEEAELRYETFSSKVQILRNKLRLLTEIMGGVFMNVLSDIMEGITPIIDKFSDWIMKIAETNPEILDFIAKTTLLVIALFGVVTGLSAVGWAYGFMVEGLSNVGIAAIKLSKGPLALLNRSLGRTVGFMPRIGKAFSGLFKLLFSKVGLVLLAIAALAGVFYYLWNTNEGFRDGVISAWDMIKSAYERTLGWISTQIENLAPVFEKAKEKISAVLEPLGRMFGSMKDRIGEFVEESGGISGVIEKSLGPLNMLLSLFLGLKGPLGLVLRGFIELVTQTSFLSDVADVLSGNMSLSEFFSNLSDNIQQVISNMADLALDMIEVGSSIIDSISEGIQKYLPVLIEVGLDIVNKLLESVTTNLPLIIDSFSSLVENIASTITEQAPVLFDTAKTLLESWVSVAAENFPLVLGLIVDLLVLIVNTITENLPLIVMIGVEMIQSIVDGITEFLPVLVDAIIFLIFTILDIIIDHLPTILDAGVDILLAVIAGFNEIMPQFVDAIIGLIHTFLGIFVDMLPTLIDIGITVILAVIAGMITVSAQIAKAAWTLLLEVLWAIIKMLPDLLWAGMQLVWEIIKGLFRVIGDLYDAGKDLVKEVVDGLLDRKDRLLASGKEIIESALDGVKEKFTDFKNAGKNIVNSIRDGLIAAKDRVKEGIGKVTDTIRGFLPFSPAKEGALKDIMDVQIAESIAKSIDKGSKSAVRSMAKLSSDIMDETPTIDIASQVANSNAAVRSAVQHAIVLDDNSENKQPAEITLVFGDRTYRTFVEDLTKEQQWILE